MTLAKAKHEFQLRYYLWATSEFEKEIDASFPNFKSFKSGSVWKVHQLMLTLPKQQQLVLAKSLLKRFHPEIVQYLNEPCSSEEESLRRKRDTFFGIYSHYEALQHLEQYAMIDKIDPVFRLLRPTFREFLGEDFSDYEDLKSRLDAIFWNIPVPMEKQVLAREQAGEKPAFASRRRIRKVIIDKFRDSFGDQCFGMESLAEEEDLEFKMRCAGWILSTHFDFGRKKNVLNYSHSISSEATFAHLGNRIPKFVLAFGISFSSWLGITSQNEWEYLTDPEVESACDAAIKLCQKFFDVAPKLLKGLNPSEITEGQ